MNKKLLFIMLFLLVILIPVGAYFALKTNRGEETVDGVSIPISNDDYEVEDLVKYTHPSGDFGYSYPKSWEFVPKRQDMGLRPKSYCCAELNEIVTVLHFDLTNTTFEKVARDFDGVGPHNWTEFTNHEGTVGYSYTLSSNNLEYTTHWFDGGTFAIKMMFRSYDRFSTDDNTDHSAYRSDFDLMLNSLKLRN